MWVIAVILLSLLAVTVAKAQSSPYPWCSEHGGDSGLGTNCGFMTLEQCQWAASGNGGFCRPNLFYTAPTGAAQRRGKKR